MSEELGILIYIIIGVTLFLFGSYQVRRADKEEKRSMSPTSTDSLIGQWLLLSICWPVIIMIVPVLLQEYLRERRVKNGDPYIMPYGKYVFKKDLDNPKKLEKRFFGDTGRSCGKFPFIVISEDIKDYRNQIHKLKIQD